MQIVSPDEFNAPVEVQLPSQQGTDKGVLLRRPDVIDLITSGGDVPDLLTDLVLSRVNSGEGQAELAITRETLPEISEALNVVVKAAFVQPKLWDRDDSDGTHMPVKWLSFSDKAFVFAWALGGEYQAAKSFRDEQAAGVEAVPAVNGTQRRTKSKNRATT